MCVACGPLAVTLYDPFRPFYKIVLLMKNYGDTLPPVFSIKTKIGKKIK